MKKNTLFSLTEETRRKIKQLASALGKTSSQIIEEAIEQVYRPTLNDYFDKIRLDLENKKKELL